MRRPRGVTVFDEFETEVRLASLQWNQNRPSYASEPGTRACYEEMTDILFERIGDRIPESLKTAGVQHGLRVIGRFAHIAARKGAKEGFSLDQLVTVMHQPATKQSVMLPAQHHGKIAHWLETTMGLTESSRYYEESEILAHYTLTDYGIALKNPQKLRIDATTTACSDGHRIDYDSRERGCPAHKKGVVIPSYEEIMRICEFDENLFAATLGSKGLKRIGSEKE